MCGKYGCKNCMFFCYYPSFDYYVPDEYYCAAIEDESHYKEVNENITYTDEELDNIFDRVYGDGEEWDSVEEQICPYYIERIEKIF